MVKNSNSDSDFASPDRPIGNRAFAIPFIFEEEDLAEWESLTNYSRAGRLDLTDSPEPVLTSSRDQDPDSFSSLPKRESALGWLEELLAMDKNIFSKVSPISFKKRKGWSISQLESTCPFLSSRKDYFFLKRNIIR